jgi:site-specific DNA recombinase
MSKDNFTNESKTPCYIYQRVSSDRQSDGQSLDEQQRQNREYAERKNLVVVESYIEIESAADNNRPVFHKMIDDARRNKIKCLVYHKIDRAARNLKDQSLLEDLIKNEKFELHFVADGICTLDPNWQFVFIQFGFAKYYIENLKKEIEKGTIGMLHAGKNPNPCPTGYLDKGLGVKEPDPIQSRLVKRAFEFYASGTYDIATLTDKMLAMGMNNRYGRPINKQTLYKLLKNKFYYGRVVYRGVEYQGSHKELISKKLFDKVQIILEGKGFKRIRTHYYVFQGLIPCPGCNKPLRSVSAKKHYKYYCCRNKKCTAKVNLPESKVELIFLDQLKLLEFSDKEVELFLRAVRKFREDLQSSQATDIRQIEMEEAKIKNQLKELMIKSLDKQITDEEYKFMKAELLNRQQTFMERRGALNTADTKICAQIAEIGKLLKRPVNAYQIASFENKRKLVKSMATNFSWNGEKLMINWKKEFEIVKNRHDNSSGGPRRNRTAA